jgi:molecular chaperone GrpE (heat shock protein)
MEETRTRLN